MVVGVTHNCGNGFFSDIWVDLEAERDESHLYNLFIPPACTSELGIFFVCVCVSTKPTIFLY